MNRALPPKCPSCVALGKSLSLLEAQPHKSNIQQDSELPPHPGDTGMTGGRTLAKSRQVWGFRVQAGRWPTVRWVGKKTMGGGGGEEEEGVERKAKEWLKFLPPDAASLRSSEPSSYVYRALGRGRGGCQTVRAQAANSGWGRLWGGIGDMEGVGR